MTTINPLASLFNNTGTTAATTGTGSTATTGTSSTDISARVEQILAKQNTVAPKLNAQLTVDRTKLSGLGQLQSALAAFQSVAQSLAGGGLAAAATSSATDVLTAKTTSSAAAGSHAVEVQQLATSQILNSKAQTSATAAIGTGATTTIKIEFGTTTGNAFAAVGKAANITINSASNSLQGIATAINDANTGVTAKVVQGKDGYVLSLTSPTGAESSMRITATGDNAVQSLVGYNPAGTRNLTAAATAQNALLTVDGKAATSASNTVAGAIDGATLTLKTTGSSTVAVKRDSSQVASNISSLVAAYNTLNDKLTSLQQGDLKTTNAVRNIQNQLASMFQFGSSAGDGVNLSSLGITRSGGGNLTVDNAKLQSAITANADSVGKFFTNSGSGLADKLATQIGLITGQGGSVSQAVASVNQDITTLTAKKAAVEKSLTAQGNALMKFYTDQANGSGSSAASGIISGISSPGSSNLFDMLG